MRIEKTLFTAIGVQLIKDTATGDNFLSLKLVCNIFPVRSIPPSFFSSAFNKGAPALFQSKIKSIIYLRKYAEACNESRGPSPRLSVWPTQLRRNVATVASRWRRCADLTSPRIKPQTYRTDSVRLTTELILT